MIPHPFDFDPTYGYSRNELLSIVPPSTEPPGFPDFWHALRDRSGRVPLNLALEELLSPDPDYRLIEATFTIHPGYRVGAWVICPREVSGVRYGIVVGHGYGGREAAEWDKAGLDRAVIFPVAPGFHISAHPHLPFNDASLHVIHGIDNKDDYLLGACACALWRSIDVLESIVPGRIGHFHYLGWSFGGGMGALILPWEPRFSSAELGQPTFGNHPLRLRVKCAGSGESVRQLHVGNPQIEETLSFFDAATTAKYLTIPVVFGCALFDPAVPPPGQFSVANAHPGRKRISVFLTGHFDYQYDAIPSEESLHRNNLAELLGPVACPAR